jgi:hypothetical protein
MLELDCNVYESSREDPSMYIVDNKGERERRRRTIIVLQGKRRRGRKLVVSCSFISSHLFDGVTPQVYRFLVLLLLVGYCVEGSISPFMVFAII